jgi:hypothetical protein
MKLLRISSEITLTSIFCEKYFCYQNSDYKMLPSVCNDIFKLRIKIKNKSKLSCFVTNFYTFFL